jgi:phosphatidylserine decarboxylase
MKLYIFNRQTKQKEIELVHCGKSLSFLYGKKNLLNKFFLFLIAKSPYFSRFIGFLCDRSFSTKKIRPFVSKYHLDENDFEKKIDEYSSFNDFFIRKLKSTARVINEEKEIAIMPADARYMVFPNINELDGFYVKGKKFSLENFLQNKSLAKRYKNGSLVIGRLNPSDYHRFHFPFRCVANESTLINGSLFSVNPIAIKKNISIFSENKRMITTLTSDQFGIVLFIEIGATNVGSINQTFTPNKINEKGEEKGYFSLGGSSIALLFEKGKIQFDNDLISFSKQNLETKALLGQSLGRSIGS